MTKPKPKASALSLSAFASLFTEFREPSWEGWRGVLARVSSRVRELWLIAGRGAGKSRAAALIGCWAGTRTYKVAPGESIFVGLFAPDRKQAAITYKYLRGLFRAVPALEAMVVSETRDSLSLSNHVTVEVLTASKAAPRGRAYAAAIVEEAAFLPTGDSANPDVELLRALRPALARVPGSLLVVLTSPYARRGIAWDAARKYEGQPDAETVYVRAATLELNPLFDRAEIQRAFAEDPQAAAAEYGAEFRTDVEGFVSLDAIEAVTVAGRRELAPVPGVRYVGFTDPSGSGGGGDSFTLGIAHAEVRDAETVLVLDLLREVRPPFSPEGVCEDYAATLKAYGLAKVTGDRYAGEWPREQFRKHGIEYALSDRPKSDIYRDSLPALNSGCVELLAHPRMLAQLGGLERRTARGGRDTIDHAPGGRDDLANAALGALLLAEKGATSAHAAAVAAGIAPVGTPKPASPSFGARPWGGLRFDGGGDAGPDPATLPPGGGWLQRPDYD